MSYTREEELRRQEKLDQREGIREMMAATLTTKKRNDLPRTAFAIPETREYPIHDIEHARNALARAAQNETGARLSKVRGAVYRRYPHLKGDAKSIEMILDGLDARAAMSDDEKRKIKTARDHLIHGRHVKAFGVLNSMVTSNEHEPDPNDANEPYENFLGLP